VRVFVEFLVQFCAPEELVGRLGRLAEESRARPEAEVWMVADASRPYAAGAAVAEAPQLPQPWAIAVEAKLEAGRFDDALATVEAALVALPADLELRLELAQTLAWSDAAPMLARALELSIDAAEAAHQRDAASMARVRALARLGRAEETLEALAAGLGATTKPQRWGLLLVDVLAVCPTAPVRALLVGPAAEALAPWVVALDLLDGRTIAVAPEVAEMAADLVSAVRQARARLGGGGAHAPGDGADGAGGGLRAGAGVPGA
jgi:tetratricopeptide (TPR) repeat protein